jgi:hypothetical protein
MAEAPSATDRQRHGRWQFTLRSLFLFTLSIAIGLSFWKTEGDWYGAALVTISFWIVFGLVAQVCDIYTSLPHCENSPPEDRWGRRFSIFWRLALCGLIGLCFITPFLISFHLVAPSDSKEFIHVSSRAMWRALLIISIIVAVASSPRFARPDRQGVWSRAVDLLGGAAALALFVVLLLDRLCIVSLVHITVAGIMSAAPLWCAEDTVSTYSRDRVLGFVDVTTSGVLAVLASCALLRLLALCWRRAMWPRICLGAMLAVSLAIMLRLTATVVLIEVPRITPVLAANIPAPTPYRWTPAIALTLLLTAVVAYRWSKLSAAGLVAGGVTWRRSENRYCHEWLVLLFLLAGVGLAECIKVLCGMFAFGWWPIWEVLPYLVTEPMGALSLALILLAAQGVFSSWSKRRDAVAPQPAGLRPGLFLLVWTALLMIVLCAAPVFAAWGFALWLR